MGITCCLVRNQEHPVALDVANGSCAGNGYRTFSKYSIEPRFQNFSCKAVSIICIYNDIVDQICNEIMLRDIGRVGSDINYVSHPGR
jgi:hypothetical protein